MRFVCSFDLHSSRFIATRNTFRVNSFAATGNYSRQRALSAGVDQNRHILHSSEIYDISHSNGLWETTKNVFVSFTCFHFSVTVAV